MVDAWLTSGTGVLTCTLQRRPLKEAPLVKDFAAQPGSALRSLAALGAGLATIAAVIVGAILAVFAAATVAGAPRATSSKPATWAATTGWPTAGTSAANARPPSLRGAAQEPALTRGD